MSSPSKTISVRGLRLPVADAIAKIQADPAISDSDKAWLTGKIQQTGFAGVIVDAHEHQHQGNLHLHLSITKLF